MFLEWSNTQQEVQWQLSRIQIVAPLPSHLISTLEQFQSITEHVERDLIIKNSKYILHDLLF